MKECWINTPDESRTSSFSSSTSIPLNSLITSSLDLKHPTCVFISLTLPAERWKDEREFFMFSCPYAKDERQLRGRKTSPAPSVELLFEQIILTQVLYFSTHMIYYLHHNYCTALITTFESWVFPSINETIQQFTKVQLKQFDCHSSDRMLLEW